MYDHSSPFALTQPPGAEPKAAFGLKRLRRALIDCELQPGSQWSEPEIATRFGIGRAAIRVALTTLAGEGLVTAEPRRGWRVAPMTGALIGDILKARRTIEPGLATIRLSADDAARLAAPMRIGAALQGRDDRQALATIRSMERQVLDPLAARAGGLVGSWLAEAWNQTDRIVAFFDLAGRHHRPIDREPLVEALARGDAEAARHAIDAAITAFQGFVTDGLLSLPSALAPAGAKDDRQEMKNGPDATAPQARPQRPSQQGDRP
jgi:DNA-binding GntR family transcriptional regulator